MKIIGCVRLWDQRQKSPVLSLEPVAQKDDTIADCWCVAYKYLYLDSGILSTMMKDALRLDMIMEM
jgi:hypothetical protein